GRLSAAVKVCWPDANNSTSDFTALVGGLPGDPTIHATCNKKPTQQSWMGFRAVGVAVAIPDYSVRINAAGTAWFAALGWPAPTRRYRLAAGSGHASCWIPPPRSRRLRCANAKPTGW